MIGGMTESFPRQQARTRRFTLGVPRAFCVSPDGTRITFLRSKAGDDPVTCLWEADAGSGMERLVADPRALGADEENLPPQERARRERVRETAAGIVAYATDKEATLAVFALSGQVYCVPLGAAGAGAGGSTARARLLPAKVPALDPRPSPDGTRVAYVHDGALRVIDLASGDDAVVAQEADVTYGLAEFAAAEEMGRSRGYWWSPDGTELLVARVDESMVARWHIADPANPDQAPAEVAYPAAGTANADVSLLVAAIPAAAQLREASGWDRDAFPYLVSANWDEAPLIVVQSRDQRTMRVIDAATGAVLREDTDPHWTDVVSGVPAQLANGAIVWTAVADDTRSLIIAPTDDLAGATAVTPPGLQVRSVLGTDGDDVLFAASSDPTEVAIWRYGPGGLAPLATAPGLHSAAAGGGTLVLVKRSLDSAGATVSIKRDTTVIGAIGSFAEQPNVPHPAPHFLDAGDAGIRTAVLFPSWHTPGAGTDVKLPVLMCPYGGPGHQEVVKSAHAYLAPQWLAEQGFAVVIADGRGTPGRGPAWDRMIAGDFATGVLEDQVTALEAAAAAFAELDTSRVGIRGWSFGGYLSALAVLRRPDVFHAAVAGAPVTDWSLYDTHYTERYLGDPGKQPDVYQRSSIIDYPERTLTSQPRPLLLIHGLADDNVFAAHTLRLSSALLAAGYPHSVLPLSGITHMTPQETVAENMLLLQVAFLREALGV
jgi:dipeptidyl-peptidase-4